MTRKPFFTINDSISWIFHYDLPHNQHNWIFYCSINFLFILMNAFAINFVGIHNIENAPRLYSLSIKKFIAVARDHKNRLINWHSSERVFKRSHPSHTHLQRNVITQKKSKRKSLNAKRVFTWTCFLFCSNFRLDCRTALVRKPYKPAQERRSFTTRSNGGCRPHLAAGPSSALSSNKLLKRIILNYAKWQTIPIRWNVSNLKIFVVMK